MAAIAPVTQASTIAQRKRTDSCPATVKKEPTKAIVAGRSADWLDPGPLDLGERKVTSWQIRTDPEPTGRRRARFPSPQGSTSSATSVAG